jgi:RimJ/RimL family protein N-acetyltransferase
MPEFRLQTERLILRDWRSDDLDPFAAMCADPVVMATLGPVMDRDQTAALMERISAISQTHGFTAWALERREDGRFLGWCGLIPGTFAPILGEIEVGWRLAADMWGQGYAREAAIASLNWGFANLSLDAIWAITSVGNSRSWGLMERLGMVRQHALDFDHPKLPAESPLLRHVTYRMGRDEWPGMKPTGEQKPA